MTNKAEQLLNEVLQLPQREQWTFVQRLLDEMDIDGEDEHDPAWLAWLAEVERRVEGAVSGRIKGISASEVFAEGRKRLQRS